MYVHAVVSDSTTKKKELMSFTGKRRASQEAKGGRVSGRKSACFLSNVDSRFKECGSKKGPVWEEAQQEQK